MIFIDIIEKNPYLISLIEKYEFIKKLEEDFEIEKQIFIDLIGCLLSNLIEVSDNFINMFANSKIFFTILNVLKHDELIVPQKNIQLLKLLHNFLKIYSDIKLLSTYLNENIIKIISNYSSCFYEDNLRSHILYIINYMIENNSQKLKLNMIKGENILKNILKFEYNFTNGSNVIVTRILGNFMTGDNETIEVIL